MTSPERPTQPYGTEGLPPQLEPSDDDLRWRLPVEPPQILSPEAQHDVAMAHQVDFAKRHNMAVIPVMPDSAGPVHEFGDNTAADLAAIRANVKNVYGQDLQTAYEQRNGTATRPDTTESDATFRDRYHRDPTVGDRDASAIEAVAREHLSDLHHAAVVRGHVPGASGGDHRLVPEHRPASNTVSVVKVPGENHYRPAEPGDDPETIIQIQPMSGKEAGNREVRLLEPGVIINTETKTARSSRKPQAPTPAPEGGLARQLGVRRMAHLARRHKRSQVGAGELQDLYSQYALGDPALLEEQLAVSGLSPKQQRDIRRSGKRYRGDQAEMAEYEEKLAEGAAGNNLVDRARRASVRMPGSSTPKRTGRHRS